MLRTDRLTLREMTDCDLDAIAALLGDETVMRYYPRTKTREEAASWIRWNRQLYEDHGFGLWIMTLGEAGEFVGQCGLTIQTVDGKEEIEIGYHVMPGHQRCGYASEAAARCRDFAREQLSIDRLIAVINPANVASQAVAERIGLRPEKSALVYGEERLIYASHP